MRDVRKEIRKIVTERVNQIFKGIGKIVLGLIYIGTGLSCFILHPNLFEDLLIIPIMILIIIAVLSSKKKDVKV